MNKLSPTVEEIEALRRDAAPGPVVIINLLKFKADGGREAYVRYMRTASAVSDDSGVELIYTGAAGPDVAGGEDWDYVIIARYRCFDAFADAVTHPAYRASTVFRPDALEKTLMMVSRPVPIESWFGI